MDRNTASSSAFIILLIAVGILLGVSGHYMSREMATPCPEVVPDTPEAVPETLEPVREMLDFSAIGPYKLPNDAQYVKLLNARANGLYGKGRAPQRFRPVGYLTRVATIDGDQNRTLQLLGRRRHSNGQIYDYCVNITSGEQLVKVPVEYKNGKQIYDKTLVSVSGQSGEYIFSEYESAFSNLKF